MTLTRRTLTLSLAPTFAALPALAWAADPTPRAPGLDLAGMDKAVKPGDDFFAYANGTWMKTAKIPADRSSWGISGEAGELTSQQLRAIDEVAGSATPGSEARKVGDYYASFMDEARIESLGLTPAKPVLDRIAAIATKAELAAELSRQLRADVDPLNSTNFRTGHLFGLFVEQDLMKPGVYAPYLLQGGIGLPDRDYYLATSTRMADIRTAYVAHIAKVLKLAGAADADAQAARIMALETKIAAAHATRDDSDDIVKSNNPWPRAAFPAKAPGLDWNAYFTAAGLMGQQTFIVWHPGAVTGEAALVASEPLSVWKEYLALRHLEEFAAFLPKAFVDEQFAFFNKTLNGTPQQPVRWKRATAATDNALGMAVGKLYVAKHFPPDSKTKVQAMVNDITKAFGARIDALAWMTPATKAEAKRKLATLKVGVGYPDKWIDYSSLKITAGDAYGNALRASEFEYRRNLAKFGKPVDRGEWAMNPQLVNAVNLPVKNALNFPAAILQAPDFDPRNPASMNYGGIGATIGHEISHSFDNLGAMFDSQGRLRNWWTPADLEHFEASGKALADQYSAYKPFPDLHLNGELVLGENIADIAGLNAAFDAYRAANGGKEGPTQQGFTGDQQFFIAFAQSWRTKVREAQARQRVITDGHAPAEYRADTVRNMDAWYQAFAVKTGETLYLPPAGRVRVW